MPRRIRKKPKTGANQRVRQTQVVVIDNRKITKRRAPEPKVQSKPVSGPPPFSYLPPLVVRPNPMPPGPPSSSSGSSLAELAILQQLFRQQQPSVNASGTVSQIAQTQPVVQFGGASFVEEKKTNEMGSQSGPDFSMTREELDEFRRQELYEFARNNRVDGVTSETTKAKIIDKIVDHKLPPPSSVTVY